MGSMYKSQRKLYTIRNPRFRTVFRASISTSCANYSAMIRLEIMVGFAPVSSSATIGLGTMVRFAAVSSFRNIMEPPYFASICPSEAVKGAQPFKTVLKAVLHVDSFIAND